MKIAIPCWQGRVSPVFDVARHLVLVDPDRPDETREITLDQVDPFDRAGALAAEEVDLLICGAVSQPCRAALAGQRIEVLAGICGPVDSVIEAHGTGALVGEGFAMPGCRRRRRHRGGRQEGGRGGGRGWGGGRGRGRGRGAPGGY